LGSKPNMNRGLFAIRRNHFCASLHKLVSSFTGIETTSADSRSTVGTACVVAFEGEKKWTFRGMAL
jgi:hypothetical protein